MTTHATEAGRFVHPALFYRSGDEYLAGLVPFITDGLAAGQPVAVAVPAPKLDLLRTALRSVADRITMINMMDAGRNPGRIIANVLRHFADAYPDRHVRIIGEPIWPGRTATEYPACVQHEALINPSFAGRDVTIVCPYDTTGLGARAVADAYATHPVIWQGDQRHRSDRYSWNGVVAQYNQPFPSAPNAAMLAATTLDELPDVRRLASDQARRFGLASDRVADLLLIVTELVTNSLRHTQRPCQLRIWADHGHLACEVSDTGHLADPLAGRRPPRPGQTSGHGLLLVNGLADLVRTHTSPHGTTIRALLRLNHA